MYARIYTRDRTARYAEILEDPNRGFLNRCLINRSVRRLQARSGSFVTEALQWPTSGLASACSRGLKACWNRVFRQGNSSADPLELDRLIEMAK